MGSNEGRGVVFVKLFCFFFFFLKKNATKSDSPFPLGVLVTRV